MCVCVCVCVCVHQEAITDAVKCPVFLLPAGNDPDSVKPGGALLAPLEAKFGDKVKSVECTCVPSLPLGWPHCPHCPRACVCAVPDMAHGWVPRGDLAKPEVVRDVTKAIELAVDYFSANL